MALVVRAVQLDHRRIDEELVCRVGAAKRGRDLVLDVLDGLPDAYIDDSGAKLEAYRRFAQVRSPADADKLRDELRDRYGPIPPTVEGLFTAVRVRLAAEAAGVPEVRAEDGQVTLKWTGRMPDRREMSVALQVAGLRPDTASNQVRIPVGAGRDPIEVAIRALEALEATRAA